MFSFTTVLVLTIITFIWGLIIGAIFSHDKELVSKILSKLKDLMFDSEEESD